MVSTKHHETVFLPAEIRTVLGKKSKQLRKKGLLLGNIFGVKTGSKSLTIKPTDFSVAYRKAKATGIITIEVEKEKIPTLVHAIQRHPLTDIIMHVDFRKVDLTKKIETFVPVTVVGVSEAVAQKSGILLTQSKQLTVEALPEDIPAHIEVDISVLKEIGQEIKVSDLKVSTAYTVKELPEKVIVSVTAHKEESITPETTVAAPEVITAVPEVTPEGTEVAGAPEVTPTKEEKSEKAVEKKPTEKKTSK